VPKISGSRGPPGIPIKYAPLPEWFIISGMWRTATYEALGRGDLRAVKLNNRTLIDVEHGLAWLASLPAAEITTGRRAIRSKCGFRPRGGIMTAFNTPAGGARDGDKPPALL